MTTESVEALAAKHISVRYAGLTALDDVSLALEPGTVTGLIGPNGAGKTTLINVLSGLVAPSSGTVSFRGRVQQKWSLSRAARAGVARTFQAARVYQERLVADNISVAPHPAHDLGDDPLELVDLAHRRYDVAGTLSYGELRRLGLAIALSTGPRVLLLDEPGAGLTASDLQHLSGVINRVLKTGCTVMLVDHNIRFLMQTVGRVAMLEGGRLIADGSPDQVQADERVRAAYLGRGA